MSEQRPDAEIAMRMLRARGGDLDMKAADIIADLSAEVAGGFDESEIRGMSVELNEVFEILGRVLREGSCFSDLDTPRSLALEAVEVINKLRACLSEADARIAGLHDQVPAVVRAFPPHGVIVGSGFSSRTVTGPGEASVNYRGTTSAEFQAWFDQVKADVFTAAVLGEQRPKDA